MHRRRHGRSLFRRPRAARLKGSGEGPRRGERPHFAHARALELAKLTAKRIEDWQAALATAPKLARSSRFAKGRKETAIDAEDADAVRARRATANRTLTVLKAALNHAYLKRRVASDDAWRRVRPFRGADAPVVHFLSDDECRRLVNACEGGFRDLVRAALLTGCRYGELTRMRCEDFHAEAGTLMFKSLNPESDATWPSPMRGGRCSNR